MTPRLKADFHQTLKMARYWAEQPDPKKSPQKILRALRVPSFASGVKLKALLGFSFPP
jgi:hypothetical protein